MKKITKVIVLFIVVVFLMIFLASVACATDLSSPGDTVNKVRKPDSPNASTTIKPSSLGQPTHSYHTAGPSVHPKAPPPAIKKSTPTVKKSTTTVTGNQK